MKPINPHRGIQTEPCLACGSPDSRIRYVPPVDGPNTGWQTIPERLDVECLECGFTWRESTLRSRLSVYGEKEKSQ